MSETHHCQCRPNTDPRPRNPNNPDLHAAAGQIGLVPHWLDRQPVRLAQINPHTRVANTIAARHMFTMALLAIWTSSRRSAALVAALLVAGWTAVAVANDRPTKPLSGRTFQSQATQALQADDAMNPGMLWVEQGAKLWDTPAGSKNASCASCHGDAATSMRGVAARYPVVTDAGDVVNIEKRIGTCQTLHQSAAAFAYESNDLLALTAFVTFQARGLPRQTKIDGSARTAFERGRTFWQTRQGQMNLACGQCHDDNVGQKLRGDTISQGHSVGWPGYRLDWQGVGSLHRRLRACSLGVRAEILDFGAKEYLDLELYLAWRAEGLPMEGIGVRR